MGEGPSGLEQSRISQARARAQPGRSAAENEVPLKGPSLLGTERVGLGWSSGSPPFQLVVLPEGKGEHGIKKEREREKEC